ncbi:uncharacterized protein N7484_007512 [Penicillium longicatenatum]|uniref:uncharacterized protein n=1 Tax=Penicillium longicatenatum TaxID=1561947 RepID=UPI002546F237|nr:uncharacterized protein N7484_007512 [Penicillium longicatenatum]KAJ5639650.1 hypothetical protein N7484_007512 [Penicillium longicatenatum]
MEDTVIPLFFNSYLYLPKDPHIRNGFMEILPEMYSNAAIGSPLHTSTLAIAYFTVAAWTGQESLIRASQRCFMQTLPKIRATLLSDDDNEYHRILMSILMLSLYEEFVAFREWGNPGKAHLKGAIALVNSRRPEKVRDPSSSTLHNAVQAQIIKTSRGLDTPMVPIPEVWPLSPPKEAFSPRVFLSTAASEIVSLRKSWEKLKTKVPTEAEITSVLNKATQIDIKLVSWTYRIPENWNFVAASIIPQSVRDAGLYLNHCDCYSDMWIASTWNTYRDCRILVQCIMLNCLRLLPPHDLDGIKSAAIHSTISKMADEICGTVPYYLGSQLESVRLKQGHITYPFAETRPVTTTHKQSAPLMGPWHIMLFLRNLLVPGLDLPPEQTRWVEEQVNRVMVIYFQR